MTARPVLVVEDEWMLANMMVALLRNAGYTVLDPVNSVDAAIEAIARHHPVFALLDVTLGREKSFAIADELDSRGTPFLLMTGYAVEDLPPAYRHHGILQKPVSRERLLAEMQTWLGAPG